MPHDLTHASFFSGVGGLDLGLERAGWRTVSFSEIDPYASAVLAQRWPGVPNLGSIVPLAESARRAQDERDSRAADTGRWEAGSGLPRSAACASLWTGGFPCQDLSVAGKRRGMGEGTRSGLAYAFLALAERHRPRFVLLENVPGLLSSHGGRDMAALLGALVELGYGVGYRVLDARYFGVPQRRRRVFILGDSLGGRAGAERASEVLSVGSRCRRHPPAGIEAGEGAADSTSPGVDISFPTYFSNQPTRFNDLTDPLGITAGPPSVLRTSPDPHGVRATDELAGRLDGSRELAATLNSGGNDGGFRTEPGEHLVYGKVTRPHGPDGEGERWDAVDLASTRNSFDTGDTRAVELVTGPGGMTDDTLLPLGLDSHRYRCCGNGVVADVSYWIGARLAELA